MADSSADAIDFEFYRYGPSLALAIAATALFSLLTIAHGVRVYWHRAWYFIPFVLGGVCQIIGYSGRASSHFDKENLDPFVMQSILILIAPAFYAASIYMTLGRLVRALHAEQLSIIPIRWLTKIFVAGDVFALLIQAGGGGIQAGGSLSLYELGEKITVAGLFAQITSFGVFVAAAFMLQRRLHRRNSGEVSEVPWSRYLKVLYAVSGLILGRSVFRVIEFLQGNSGYIMSHEAFLYVLDTLPMVAVMAVLLRWYVGDLGKHPNLDSARGGISDDSYVMEEGHTAGSSK